MTVTPPEPIPESILTSTKKALGIAEDYTNFDPELIMHINSVLGNLNQLGVGPEEGYEITGATELWTDLLTNEGTAYPDKRLNPVKSYLYLKVKMLFDPPSIGYVVTATEKMIQEAEWRIMVAQDNLLHPASITEEEIPVDFESMPVILDGGVP